MDEHGIDAPGLRMIISEDAGLRGIYDEVTKTLDDDPGHDLNHVMRVALWALRIGLPGVPARQLIAAALLHDIVNVPKNSPDRARASEICANEAELVLYRHDFSKEEIREISRAIRDHSYSRGAVPETPLGDALQDADRLEALGAIGIMRTFSTGVRMGAKYFDADDPWARERTLDDHRYSIDHFFTKLLFLPQTMRTKRGRREGEKRLAFLEVFLGQLGNELGSAYEKKKVP